MSEVCEKSADISQASVSTRGRPSKLTPELRDKIVSMVEEGTPLSSIGIILGLTNEACERSVFAWAANDPELKARVMEAKVRKCQEWQKDIEQAEVGRGKDWRAKAWLMSKWLPESYADKDKANVVVNNNVLATSLSAEDFETIKRLQGAGRGVVSVSVTGGEASSISGISGSDGSLNDHPGTHPIHPGNVDPDSNVPPPAKFTLPPRSSQ